ncbi:DDB1 family protein [bacterium]|nr:DDB1 family protein [bacterium]
MFLYNLTLQTGGGITSAVYGNFSAPKAHEIVVARNKTLELLRPDDTGKTQVIFTTEVFGIIRSLAAFRLTGANRDYLCVGSDSGRIVMLNFDADTHTFKKVHQETFGKSGVRRAVPGQHLVCDPKGRAVMIGAVEKTKLVYVLNRDSQTNLTISSPLEANKSQCITFSVTALDRGLENPGFAAIELEYGDADVDSSGEAAANAQKQLTFYELDLGLNHVARRESEPIDNGANLLVPVPGGTDGPGGVLVCCENFVLYKSESSKGQELRSVIPRRAELSGERGVLLTAYASHKTKKDGFFVLAQSEYGDVYKIVLDNESGKCCGPSDAVANLKITYFDTVPTCVDLCVLRSGFLFCASEFGDHILYQFTSIGDDDSGNRPVNGQSNSKTLVETNEGYQPVFFTPTPLKNLTAIDTLQSLCPVLDAQCHELLGEETPQLYTLCGAGSRSTLRILKRGISLTEMAVSPLPGNPNAVFTVRKNKTDAFDDFIVVSFVDATLVLKIGDTVEEVTDSGFQGDMPTLSASRIGDNDLLQVHPGGLRHARADGRVNEWRCPGRKTVTKATVNNSQAVIALSGGELVYFELDTTGSLMEIEKVETSGDVACLSLPGLRKGEAKAKFVAVGSYDSTVRVMSLSGEDTLQTVGVQALVSAPNSLLLLHTSNNSLNLNAGLQNGVLLRADVDLVTGGISNARSRFLGTRPPLLYYTRINGDNAMIALSTRPWLGYTDLQNKFSLQPVSYTALDNCASFASEQCPEGIVASVGNTLRIVSAEHLNESFNAAVVKLRYTPREMSVNVDKKLLAIVESDQSSVPYGLRTGVEGPAGEKPVKDPNAMDADDDSDDELSMTPAEQFGAPKAAPGQWASCVRIVDPSSNETKQIIELEDDEAALCVCHAYFPAADELFLVVGSVVGLTFTPRDCKGGFVTLYRYLQDGRIELVHKTPVDGVPGAVCGFNGKLLCGVGNSLRLYEYGKKKLLRKSECSDFPNFVTTVHGSGDRIYVGDVQESFHYVKYKKEDGTMWIAADDSQPRHVTSAVPLDYDTMCGGDKFGNVFVTRLTNDASNEMEHDPTGGLNLDQKSVLNGAAQKTMCVSSFHVGETVCALTKGTLQSGGNESIIYCSLNGTIGALAPFISREDVDFVTHLEMHLRQEKPPLLGRDHLSFRSSYFPVKDVIDGDLCEQFSELDVETQKRIAEDMDMVPPEITKKLEDLRAAVM